ncbi:MAG: TetR/AcrR family transcriptional regulator [Eubacterium sp.]
MKSNSGEITRQKLLTIARENFYKKGFNKTTMQSISNELGIAIGSMAYYFKKKENIASTFLNDYLTEIYEVIDKRCQEPLSSFTRHAIASIPYYGNMLEDENIKRFYYELLTGGSPHVAYDAHNPFKQQVHEINLRFMYESNISYNNFHKKASNIFALSGRNELIKMLFEGEFNSVPSPQDDQ